MPDPKNPSPPADPSLWAQFAAVALQGLLAAPESNTDQSETNIARLAAAYADALSAEWAKRFLVITGDVVRGGR